MARLSAILISFAVLASAAPQWSLWGPPGSNPGRGNPFSSFPSCASSCWSKLAGSCGGLNDLSCLCSKGAVAGANSCVNDSSCDADEKEGVFKSIEGLCANAGIAVTASPEATWSAMSGAVSAWPNGRKTSAWPSGGGPPGWNRRGPFGSGRGDGWGPWGSGAWKDGPWTSWWGTGACPESTWSGWTSGSWSNTAPWTTWTACIATTTATSVYTTTVTASNGKVATVTTTGFGIQLAQATGSSSSSGSGKVSIVGESHLHLVVLTVGAVGVLSGALIL